MVVYPFFRQIHMKGSITVLRHNQPREPAQAALSSRLLLDLLVGHRSMKIAMFCGGMNRVQTHPSRSYCWLYYIYIIYNK